MSQQEITRMHGPPRSIVDQTSSHRVRLLLGCGVLAGPLFILTVMAQAFTRDGFDPARHYLSLLSLGSLGWIQTTNFIGAGLLITASAVGMRRALRGRRAGTWGPRLFAAYGISMIWAGLFATDPADGFPLGTASSSSGSSWHGVLHTVAPTVAGLALYAACLVFARRFLSLGQRRWAFYCMATVVADLGTGIAAFSTQDSRWLLLGGALTWGWASIISARLITELPAQN